VKILISVIVLVILVILFFPTRESYKRRVYFARINGEDIVVEVEASRKIRYDVIDHVLSFGGGDSKVTRLSKAVMTLPPTNDSANIANSAFAF